MKYLAFASCVLSFGIPAMAHAGTDVYPGCAVPNLKAGHHTFFVDPVKGSQIGDGSAAKPWRTLAEVLAPNGKLLSTQGHKKVGGTDPLTIFNPAGPIKAGDVIMLMSGNHGRVQLQNAFNSDFITVMAAPGQTPVVSQFDIGSAAKWVFQGIKFQGPTPDPEPVSIGARSLRNLVNIGNGYLGNSNDFIFTNNSFSTADSTSGWSDRDWLLKPFNSGIYNWAECVSIINNRFYNLLNGIGDAGAHSLIANNTITKFSNDAIDFTTGNITISRNSVSGSTIPAISPWHADAIQGWSRIVNGVEQVNDNVLIEGNNISRLSDASNGYMQGIGAYDGVWSNVTIQNNIVFTNTWHGIAWSGVNHLSILNNTVLASDTSRALTWITVGLTKSGKSSQNVVIRNNISTNFVLNGNGAIYDHNFVGATYSVNNVLNKSTNRALEMVTNSSLLSQFVQASATAGPVDLRLRKGSALIGEGSSLMAPALDADGAKRTTPVTPGAYVAPR